MKKITLLFCALLLSFCSYAQLALEGFESSWIGTPAAPPGGWVVHNEIGNITWVQSTLGSSVTPPHEGNHAAFLARENVVPSAPIPTNWLITPQFNSPNNGQLHFYSRLTYPDDYGGIYKIKIAKVTDPSVPVTDLAWVDLVPPMGEMDINPIQMTYVEKTFPIPSAYTGQQIRIAFIMQGDDKDRWLIDNVEVVAKCNPPSALASADITMTTANLSWTKPAGITNWEIAVLPYDDPFTGVGSPYTGPLPYHVTNLTPNTNYKYFVRSSCTDNGKSPWIGPALFRTPALGEKCSDPLIIPTILPYSTTNNTTNFGDNYEGVPGTGCNATSNYLEGNDVVYSYTPGINGNINISLSGTGGNAGVFVYSNCITIGNNCLAGVTASANLAGVIPSFAVTAGTTYYIVVSTNGTPQVTQYTLSLQQVYCTAPTGLTANTQTSSSANLTWSATGATAWQIAVQPAGTGLPTGNGQNVTQNTVSATATSAGVPFTPATAYEYYVRVNCGNGTYSIWTGPFNFFTTQIPANLPYTQNFDGPVADGFSLSNGTLANKWVIGTAPNNTLSKALYISNDNGASNNYTITAPSVVHTYRDIFIPAGTGEINVSFDFKAGGQLMIDYVKVWLTPVSFNPVAGTAITAGTSSGIPVGDIFQLIPNWTTQNAVVNVSTVAGTVRRLIFEWRNDGATGTQPAVAIDNISIKKITCPAPSALTLSDATPSGAAYSWAPPVGAPPTSYDYYYTQNLTAAPTDTTAELGTTNATTTTIGPFNPGETYYMWVRSSCSITEKSFWIGPVSVLIPRYLQQYRMPKILIAELMACY